MSFYDELKTQKPKVNLFEETDVDPKNNVM